MSRTINHGGFFYKIHLVFILFLFINPALLINPAGLWGETSGTKKFTLKTDRINTENFLLIFEPALAKPAGHIKTAFPEIKSDLENDIGWPLNLKPVIVLIHHNKTFRKMSSSPYVSAFAVPQRQLITIDYSKMDLNLLNLETTLKHELCHLLIHHHIKNSHVPKWLDEGVAQWASDGISELLIRKQGDVLRPAVISGTILRLGDLSHGFPYNKSGLFLAYEQSKSFVEYIVKEFGKKALYDILEGLKNGNDINTAMFTATSLSVNQLESDWHRHLNKSNTWFIWLTVHIYEILFFLAAVTSVYGFIRLSIKKKNYKDDEDEFESDSY